MIPHPIVTERKLEALRHALGAEVLAALQELGVVDRFDVAENLRGGADYLARQIIRFRRLDLALAAYNAGPARVAALGRVPAIAETKLYVSAVIACYLALAAGRTVLTARDCRAEAAP